MRDRPGGAMSGGEQQMLTMARALMGNPRMLLLDEPSEGLAPVIVEQMARMIGELQTDGLSIMLSEQNMHFAGSVAARAYIIERGAIRHEGKTRDIMADAGLRAAYLAV
jgi:branched-chain amino acid transport system ATP-binding protein